MRNLVFLLEEPSAKDLLQGLAPRLVPQDVHVQYLVFEGKQDLVRQLVRKLRSWLAPNTAFVVLRDRSPAHPHPHPSPVSFDAPPEPCVESAPTLVFRGRGRVRVRAWNPLFAVNS